jgi:hypothetical protein
MMKKSGTTFNDEINGAHCDPLYYYYYYYYYYGSLNLDVNIKKLTWSTLATSRKLIFFFKRNRTPQFQVFFVLLLQKTAYLVSRKLGQSKKQDGANNLVGSNDLLILLIKGFACSND